MLPPEVPGADEVLCTGIIGCSPNQRDSNPSASAFCATTAVSRGCCPENSEIPIFISISSPVHLGQHSTYAACQCHTLNAAQAGGGSDDMQEQHTTQEDLCTSPITVIPC